MMLRHRRLFLFLIGAGLTLIALSFMVSMDEPTVINAQEIPFEHPPVVGQEPPDVTGDNGYCLLCHAQEGKSVELADGGILNLTVTQETLAGSVHGTSNPEGPLGCVDCHTNQSFPHEGGLPASARLYTIASTENCVQCHTDQASALADGVHAEGLANGNLRSATCVDCHGAHDVQPIKDQPQLAAQVCGDCHTTIFAEYKESVHGQALLVDNDTNAATCIDCHGVHGGLNHPTTAQARNRSPEQCATCHGDKKLMEEYGISTHVFDTYLSDFHGTTVALFNQQEPNVATNKAVCYDCHGVHDIRPADDELSSVSKQNLLITCQQCHPNAADDFPDSWVGHFPPTAEDHPLLFAVNWFYKLLIPTVLGGFVVLVASDIFMRVRTRVSGGETDHPTAPSETEGEDDGDDD